ncbi:MAG TPA: ATPase, T2SS/T4P/T4SS family [Bryobacteraceae bacterium]
MSDTSWLPTNQSKVGDFTVLCSDTTAVDKKLRKLSAGPKRKGITVQGHIAGEPARIQSCWCYETKARSLTVRTDYKFKGFGVTKAESGKPVGLQWSGYQPSPETKAGFLVSSYAICHVVFQALRLKQNLNSSGLLVISGATGSLKTVLAQGLIQMRLEKLMADWALARETKRKPHLVTCEDNIESYFIELGNLQYLEKIYKLDTGAACEPANPFQPETWLARVDMPDYTPRKLHVDTDTFEDAVDDALRMKPAIFYGGEIRDGKDWKHLYRLAQSHFVVVTTHASSLVSTFGLLQNCLKIKTSAQRSELAASIQGVVHMWADEMVESFSVNDEKKERKVQFVLPSCWIRTPAGIAGYTSDGVASLVPEFAEISDTMDSFCIGRAAFAEAFGNFPKTSPAAPAPTRKWDREKARKPCSPGCGDGNLESYTKSVDSDTKSAVSERWQVGKDFIAKLITKATKWDLAGE